MVDQDLDELRRLLREAVEAARASMYTRDIEALLGSGMGTWSAYSTGPWSCGFATCLASPAS